MLFKKYWRYDLNTYLTDIWKYSSDTIYWECLFIKINVLLFSIVMFSPNFSWKDYSQLIFSFILYYSITAQVHTCFPSLHPVFEHLLAIYTVRLCFSSELYITLVVTYFLEVLYQSCFFSWLDFLINLLKRHYCDLSEQQIKYRCPHWTLIWHFVLFKTLRKAIFHQHFKNHVSFMHGVISSFIAESALSS